MSCYLFVYFTEESTGGEQVYFSLSRDGLHWQDLNGGKPVLRSTMGDLGVRDPFLVRHPISGMYYLIATDLSIRARNNDWTQAMEHGSTDIITWRSSDLLTWEGPQALRVGAEGDGAIWAPEAIWDAQEQRFLVFFAVRRTVNGKRAFRIYASHTDDFTNITEPQLYLETKNNVIDTTIIKDHDIYYRFSKDDNTARIIMERSERLMYGFTVVDAPLLNALEGLEGPECYQLPDGKWCLICDRFLQRNGYVPIVIDDLATGDMHMLKDDEFDFGSTLKRHGGVLAIDEESFRRLMNRYSVK